MRRNTLILLLWLAIGAAAAGQRGYFDNSTTCSNGATIAVTMAAGPLNYLGVNPRVACTVPKPSSSGSRSVAYTA
jgi:hypothetical protein